jgi:hypothetical protein
MGDLKDVEDDFKDEHVLRYDESQELWVSVPFTGNYVKTDGDSEPTEDNQ